MTYHAQVLFPLFNAAKHKAIPERIKLVTAVVHDTVKVVVDLKRA